MVPEDAARFRRRVVVERQMRGAGEKVLPSNADDVKLTRDDIVAAACLFLLSCLIQGLAIVLFPYFNGEQVIFGAPVADAFFWHRLASEIAAGEGIDTPLRPLYSIVLALFFQFTGNSLEAAKAVNVLLGSTSVVLSFLCFRFFAPTAVAVVLALTLATLRDFLLFSHSLLSEHAGLCFSMAALLGMLLALRRPAAWGWWAFSGIATGLSNLARPLTLLATPIVAAAVLFLFGRRSIRTWVFFFLAVAVIISPWIAHQRVHFGIWGLSSNSPEALYAATSPAYGSWTGREKTDLIDAGVVSGDASVAEWDKVFARRIASNLINAPEFWIANTVRNFWSSLNHHGVLKGERRFHGLALCLLLLAAGVYAGFSSETVVGDSETSLRRLLFVSMTLGLIATALITGLFSAMLLAGLGWAFVANRPAAVIVGSYLAGNMLSHSMFGFSSSLDRLSFMYLPFVLFFQLYPFYWIGKAGSKAFKEIGVKQGSIRTMQITAPRIAAIETKSSIAGKHFMPGRLLAMIGIVVFAVACVRLVYLNAFSKPKTVLADVLARPAYSAILHSIALNVGLTDAEISQAMDSEAVRRELRWPATFRNAGGCQR